MSSPAEAALPPPVRAMIDAAIASGDAAKVETVIALARETNPDDGAELDRIATDFAAAQQAKAEAEALAKAEAAKIEAAKAEAAKAEAAKLAAQTPAAPAPPPPPPPREGFFDNWEGKGELGAFKNTGNSTNSGIAAALKLKRTGESWSTRLQASADYQRNTGKTSREHFLLLAEARYSISERGFLFGLAEWDRDRIQGFASRSSISGGVGYKPLLTDTMQLDIKLGPAWRKTSFVDPAKPNDSIIALLAASDFQWKLSDVFSFTQDFNAYLGSDNNSYVSQSALEAAINSKLRAKISYNIEYESNPPGKAQNTDTQTRFSLVYGF